MRIDICKQTTMESLETDLMVLREEISDLKEKNRVLTGKVQELEDRLSSGESKS